MNQHTDSALAGLLRALRELADENESWTFTAPIGPGNASYANGAEWGRRAVGEDLRTLLDAHLSPRITVDDEIAGLPPYRAGSYADRNTGAACWSCAGLMDHAPSERCIYADSHGTPKCDCSLGWRHTKGHGPDPAHCPVHGEQNSPTGVNTSD